ncbi:serpin family protein [Georgenia halophila]|uniref:Serpin family protein n=1 Tax=Georgenia halophila TaxID=620889 RepID=A0ABP8LNS9_9MICO
MNRPRRRALRPAVATVAGVTAISVLAACSGAQGTELRSDAEHEALAVDDAGAVPDAVAATTELGAGLLAAGKPGENQVISPASITIALAMLAEGARGEAAEALDEVLGGAGQDRTDAYNALQAAVLEHDGDPAVAGEDELPERPLAHLANGIVIHQGFPVEPDYLDAIARGFDAGARVAELSDASGKEVLDTWVKEHTGGLIESSAIEPSPDLVLVLQNAVLLAARWASPFAEGATSDAPFTTATGERVEVETMSQTLEAAYGEVGGTQAGEMTAVRLPYTEAFAMDVVLPAEGTDPATVAAEDWAAVDEVLAGPATTQVRLRLPTLDLKTEAELREPLSELGLGPVFRPGADLSGIAPGVAVSGVAHQATVSVDEAGTVAAAVTEIPMVISAPLVEAEMSVDRPFALRIVHVETGLPLFLGAINDPRG